MKDRSRFEIELQARRVVDHRAQEIGGKKVVGELDPLERAIERFGQGRGQAGLSHARNVFDQQMAARQKTDDRQTNGFVFAPDNLTDVADECLKFVLHLRSKCN